jgi:hypothetical protein
VRIYPAGPDEPQEVHPSFETLPRAPGTREAPASWLAYVSGRIAGK